MFRQNGEQFKNAVQLPRDLLLRIVNDAHRTVAKLVHFSGGGEPLLNKNTFEAITLANNLGIPVALSTNGTYLTPEIASMVDYIRVSLNAGSKQIHDFVNHSSDGRSDFEKIINNVANSVKKKKKDFGLGFVLDHQNVDDIYSFCEIGYQCKVDFVHIRPAFLYESNNDEKTKAIMNKSLLETLRAKDRFESKGFKIFAITEKFDGFWTPRSYDRCLAVLTGICVTATGDFAVCQDRTDLRFGKDYSNGKKFEEIWQSDEHKKLVSEIYSSGGRLDACPRCVWNKRNEIIEEVFVKDEIRLDLL
jgi:MoaA/NifB/PqqE/SkfB family radical SAM enzyme